MCVDVFHNGYQRKRRESFPGINYKCIMDGQRGRHVVHKCSLSEQWVEVECQIEVADWSERGEGTEGGAEAEGEAEREERTQN